MAITLMDQSQEKELGIVVVQNKLKGMELESQLGLHPNVIFPGTPKSGVPKFLNLKIHATLDSNNLLCKL